MNLEQQAVKETKQNHLRYQASLCFKFKERH